MKFWISRDSGGSQYYDLWIEKPAKSRSGNYELRENDIDIHFTTFSAKQFHRFTDIRLNPGECRGFDGVFTIKKKRGGK
jgi:hypothetical protein